MSYKIKQETTDFIAQQHKLIIGSKALNSNTGETLDIYNPANKSKIATVQYADKSDVNLAVSEARQSFDSGI